MRIETKNNFFSVIPFQMNDFCCLSCELDELYDKVNPLGAFDLSIVQGFCDEFIANFSFWVDVFGAKIDNYMIFI